MDYSNKYISTTVFSDLTPVEEALRKLNEKGVKNIELGSIHPFEKNVEKTLERYKNNYLVHNYFPAPQTSLIVNIIAMEEEIREQSLRHVKDRIVFSKEINAGLYTFHPGYLTQPIATNLTNENWDFVYDSSINAIISYEKAFDLLLDSVKQLVAFADKYKQPIAIESSGSLDKKDFLLMQRSNEFHDLFSQINSEFLGINLNLGHLNLASRAFGFDRLDFVNQLSDKIFAMEISHNDGIDDDHEMLKCDEWYWEVINDPRFQKIPMIFEGRNTPLLEPSSLWNPQ